MIYRKKTTETKQNQQDRVGGSASRCVKNSGDPDKFLSSAGWVEGFWRRESSELDDASSSSGTSGGAGGGV